MHRLFYLIGLFAILQYSAPAIGAVLLEGETQGAFYRVEVPDNWNGELVVWNHGLTADAPAPLEFRDLGPLAALQLGQGYAVAASSFSMNGWALFESTRDNENLLNIFISQIGMPNKIYMTGGSMGGLVSLQYLESGQVGHVAAAYSLCGALSGSRVWDGLLDLRLVYDAVCAEVPGAFIPGGPDGLPADFVIDEDSLALAINACTGVLLPPPARSSAQQSRLDKISQVMRIDQNSLLENMAFALVGIANLVHNPEKLNGKNGLWNYFVDYADPAINLSIQRSLPDIYGRFRLFHHYSPSGYIGDAKLLAMHTDKDDLVVVENIDFVEDRVTADNLTSAVVVQDTADHCGFSDAEFVAGWESIRTWVDSGIQPSAASIQQNCRLLEIFGQVSGPCRIDPAYVVGDLKDKIRPRIPGYWHH